MITVFHLFYDSLFELVEPEQSVLRRLVLYSLVLSPFRVRMGKRSARKSRKCPGCLLPDSQHGFGPRSKFCEGPDDPKGSVGLAALDSPMSATAAEVQNSTELPDAGIGLEKVKLENELARLAAEETELQRAADLTGLREEVRRKRQEVESLRGSLASGVSSDDGAAGTRLRLPKHQRVKKTRSIPLKDETVVSRKPRETSADKVRAAPKRESLKFPALSDLRQDEKLARKVERKLHRLRLDEEDSEVSSGQQHSSESDSEDADGTRRKPGVQTSSRGKLRSGRSATPTSRVVRPQLWPHSELNTSFVSKSVSYDTLRLDEFVAGYATILQTLDSFSRQFIVFSYERLLVLPRLLTSFRKRVYG